MMEMTFKLIVKHDNRFRNWPRYMSWLRNVNFTCAAKKIIIGTLILGKTIPFEFIF